MRFRLDQLEAHLSRQGLAALYLVSGDEPLQALEAVDRIRAEAHRQGVDERIVLTVETGFEWSRFEQAVNNLSLFGTRRLIELRLGTVELTSEGARAVIAYAERPRADTLLVISSERIDKKLQQSKWLKAIDRAGVILQMRPVAPTALPQWILQRARALGLDLSPEAAAFISVQVEGNLLAARQEIERLTLLSNGARIDLGAVMAAVADSSRYGVFTLVDCAFAGNLARALRVLQGLRREGVEPAIVNWALTRELRTLCPMARKRLAGIPIERILGEFQVWDKRRPAIRQALERHTLEALWGLLVSAGRIDRIIKGLAPGNPWDEIGGLCAHIAVSTARAVRDVL